MILESLRPDLECALGMRGGDLLSSLLSLSPLPLLLLSLSRSLLLSPR